MIDLLDIGWIAGFIEGEGTFGCRGKTVFVSVSQVQKEPIDRLHAMLGGKVYRIEQMDGSRRMAFYKWFVHNEQARGLIMTLFALMSPRRKAQMKAALAPWLRTGRLGKYKTECRRGHPLAGPNLGINPTSGGRYCRACQVMLQRVRYERRKKENIMPHAEESS